MDEASMEPIGDRGFKARKREDHALALIDRLKESLADLAEVRRILRELGRYYDPALGGVIMEVGHQRAIVEALEAGRHAEALTLIQERYELYLKDRAYPVAPHSASPAPPPASTSDLARAPGSPNQGPLPFPTGMAR